MEGNKDNFVFAGFNVRKWPWSEAFNADDSGWDFNDLVMEQLQEKFDIYQNDFQLFMPRNNEVMKQVNDFISKIDEANIAALELPISIVKLSDDLTGYKVSESSIHIENYRFRGFDICDIDGMFSALHHPKIGSSDNQLLGNQEYTRALELANYANFIDKNHSPFSVTKVYSLK